MTSENTLPARPLDSGSQRLEFFSDAILAIAITLLIFGIKLPKVVHQDLGHALLHQWPSFLAYALTFCTIGLVWVAHHSMFRRIRSVDRPLLLINLFLMLWIAFLPYSTMVLARYSWKGTHDAAIAVLFYSLNQIAIGVGFTALWLYLAFHESLFIDAVTRASVWSSLRRSAIVPSAYVLTSLLAFVSVLACYLIWLAITIYIVLGPATRRLAIWSAPAPEPAEPSPSADASP